MLKVLLPVDGSENAVRATQELIKTLDWYKEQPAVDPTRRSLARTPVPEHELGRQQ